MLFIELNHNQLVSFIDVYHFANHINTSFFININVSRSITNDGINSLFFIHKYFLAKYTVVQRNVINIRTNLVTLKSTTEFFQRLLYVLFATHRYL